jgi:3-hydroxyisobutyrate dehydrogenase
MQLKTGFIGLGAMGQGMTRNLQRHALLTGVWNRSSDKAVALARELAVKAATSPAELAAQCDVVVLCVSADADVLQMIDAILPSARPGLTVIDCSTVAAATAQTAAQRLAQAGAAFLDCPVSGGVEGAKNGTLAIMCGGDAATFAAAQPVLKAMGQTITHMGPTGFGQAAKATNQILCAGVIQAVAEAMAFAKAHQLPLPQLIETLGKGAGSSWYFVHRAPFMANAAFPAGFKVRLHDKDLRICQDMAAQHQVQLSVIESTRQAYQTLMQQGFGDEDISSLFRLKDALFARG